jgi:hypothetical protein
MDAPVRAFAIRLPRLTHCTSGESIASSELDAWGFDGSLFKAMSVPPFDKPHQFRYARSRTGATGRSETECKDSSMLMFAVPESPRASADCPKFVNLRPPG